MKTLKPTAPANRADLKTWTPEQLTYAAPFWVARLQKQALDDLALLASIQPATRLHLDALKIAARTKEQLTYWQLVLSDRIFRALPPSLRSFKRSASYDHTGLTKRSTTVGDWDKTLGLWG